MSVAACAVCPPAPEHDNVNDSGPPAVGVSTIDPDDGCTPLHAPLAVQDVVFVAVHVRVDVWPTAIFGELNDIVTAGAGVEFPPPPPPHADSTNTAAPIENAAANFNFI